MRHRRLQFVCLASGLLAASQLSPAHASENPESKASESVDKPSEEPLGNPLFDGETLKNWKPTDFGREGKVSVKDGVLIIGKGEPMTGVTWDGGDLPKVDYELRLEAKRIAGDDFFCGLTFPVGKNCCSLILGGWGGSLTGLSSINYMDASENETSDFYDFELDKWYKVRIRVTQTKIEAMLDDITLADVEYTDKKIGIRFEMEPCKPLGVATYRTAGGVRNFRLFKLDEDGEPITKKEAERR